jgi:hypothetical protein
MLVRLAGVLDGEGMQVELRLHPCEELEARLEQADPDQMARPLRPLARLVNGDIRYALAVGVDARGDDLGRTARLVDPR